MSSQPDAPPAAGCPNRGAPCPTAELCSGARSCLGEPAGRDRVSSVLRSLQRMREHPAHRQSLADLAQTALLSPFYFHRVFRRVTATTPSRFLTALRMADAKRLLTETSLPAALWSRCGGASRARRF